MKNDVTKCTRLCVSEMEDTSITFSMMVKFGALFLLMLVIDVGWCSTCNNNENDPKECQNQLLQGGQDQIGGIGASEQTDTDVLTKDEDILKFNAKDSEDNKHSKANEYSKSINNLENVNEDGVQQEEHLDDNDISEANDDSSDIIDTSNSSIDSNSTFLHWLKYILDPIIEEFRDGIYVNNSDFNSSADSNNTNVTLNETILTENVNATAVEMINSTVIENSTTTESDKKVKFHCVGRNVTDNANATVKLTTTAKLLQMLNFEKNGTENVTDCLLVMFYAPWCHFCAKTAPHYNALARAFPQLDFVAVDTAQFNNLLARFGTVSVPNILVFHHSRSAIKFNHTERTLVYLKEFVTNTTGFQANQTVNVTEEDYIGPVPSTPTNEPDYLLMISWIFVILCSTCMFVKSTKGQQWINKVRILWQEHQHID